MTTTPQITPSPEAHPLLRHPVDGDTNLFLIRHGQTDANLRGMLHGKTDLPLAPFGIRQAHRIATRIHREVIRIDALLTSPLSRAKTTATIIGEQIGVEPMIIPELVEMDFGALEGYTIDQIVQEHPELAEQWLDIHDNDLAWPSGESRRQFHDRVLAVFQAILVDYPAHAVAVVAHGGVLGSYLAQVQGLPPNGPDTYQVPNCSLTHLAVTAEHTVIHCLNDVLHLSDLDAEELG